MAKGFQDACVLGLTLYTFAFASVRTCLGQRPGLQKRHMEQGHPGRVSLDQLTPSKFTRIQDYFKPLTFEVLIMQHFCGMS